MRLVVYASYDPTNLIGRVVDAFRERGASAIGVSQAYGLTGGRADLDHPEARGGPGATDVDRNAAAWRQRRAPGRRGPRGRLGKPARFASAARAG